ncbi:CDP-Glycerol:Poly(glycerophosphate) glycerophosphotransferase [Brevibacterium siliguriense]|uniref:CDP-Glycerol:Poly(Glycerophosphate) glycerophosphotransferase n=1 Tax=Brevibacterium siliguriense TaxID=1136497 RepID=A0A1H1QJ77_9MICO|nr:CDP-glycerol glycerophosphotransferase family protein [Brevibacterium siliguriense]SDS23373.1 CDP-Glycerol:Poly(glycerophosphate) glycerophosphotransferase [Brevibacterium siliguriense]
MTFLPAELPNTAVRGAAFAQSAVKLAALRLRERVRESRLPDEFHPQDDDAFVAAAYFAGDLSSVYQLEQWLWPFEQLETRLKDLGFGDRPFGIIVRNSLVARHLKGVTSFPVRFSRLTKGLDEFMQAPSLRAVFYVNQGTSNFQALRYPEPAHVHLSHGESEKISMISNQLKGYDYVFTAGQAARERIEQTLYGMSDDRMFDVGRPQLDRPRSIPPEWKEFEAEHPDGKAVFYAPTWEGDSPSMAYGTIAYNGTEIVTSLLEAGYRVIFRPHPRTGVMCHEFEKAVEDVAEIVESDPRGFLDKSPDVSWQLDEADLAVVEMTSVAFDWLASGKPLVMVKPHGPDAEVLEGGLLDRCPAVDSMSGESVVDLIGEAISRRGLVSELAQFYLGDTAVGEQTARFIQSSERVIRIRTDERRVKRAE